jgi:hypothetical protein
VARWLMPEIRDELVRIGRRNGSASFHEATLRAAASTLDEEQRVEAVRRATGRVKSSTSIDFEKDIRGR